MREAYRKAGLKPEEMDWEQMGMDIKTCAKEMTIRPAKYVCHACVALFYAARCVRRQTCW